ncbi:MAG: hypothetical protein JW827_11940, partial [Spirochaetes bacterium]|nr:hypothetical protein [Spirochaetota bacterium]
MNIVQFMKQFMGMEKKFDLFHVQNREKIYYWDLARLEIFEDLYFSRITRSPIHIYPEQTAIRKIHGLLTLLFKAVKNETLRFIKTFKKRYDYILFTCSRYRDKKGNTVDWASEDILSRIRQRSFLIETILPVDQKIRKGFYYLYGLALRRIRNHIIYKYGKRKESFPVNA